MSLPRLSVDRPIGVAMLYLGIILVGLVSLVRMPIDLLPDIAYPQLVIHASDAGVSPTEIERSLTEPIERAVASVPGVERVESVSGEGVSLVTVRFAWGADMDFAALNVRERLDNIRGTLPPFASAPVVLRTDPRSEPVLTVSVSGPSDLRALKEISEQVFKRRLEQLEGVAYAAVTGGLEREIQVDVDPRLMESHGLTIDDVAAALGQANVAGQGGTVRQGRYRYALRTLGEFRTPEEIGEVSLRLGRAGGLPDAEGGSAEGAAASIRLRDVATITDGVRERESIARFSGVGAEATAGGIAAPEAGGADATGTGAGAATDQPTRRAGTEAVGLLIFKTTGENTVRVAEGVEATLAELRQEYPDFRLEIAMSQAGFISDAISNVLGAVIYGGLLTFLVLFLFLRDARYPVAVSVSIPISVIGSFALLEAAGVTLNIMTLGGLAFGVGIFVDNSIVVLENIFRHRQLGLGQRAAAVVGAREVQGAITAGTLATVAVFAPIVYVQGVAGELFGALSLAVGFSVLVSLLVALTLLPVMASRWDEESARKHGWVGRGWKMVASPFGRALRRVTDGPLARWDRGYERFEGWYHRLLERSLDNRGRVVWAAGAMLVLSVPVAAMLERSVLPEIDQGGFQLRLELERGTPLERTGEGAEHLERLLLADDAVDAVFTHAGRAEATTGATLEDAGYHTATLDVRLRHDASTAAVVERLRGRIEAEQRAGSSPVPAGAVAFEIGGATGLGRLLGGTESDLTIRVASEDLNAALEHAGQVQARLAGVESLTNVRLGSELGHPEVRVEIDRERAASFGIPPRAVAETIDRAMRGTEATQFADFDLRVPVMVRYPEEARTSLATLDELRIEGVPVRQLVSLETGLGPSEVHRLDQGRMVPVYADVAGGGLARALGEVEAALRDLPPPPGIVRTFGGENEEMQRSFRDLAFAFGLAVLLVYMILAAQFESLLHPFTILLTVPLAVAGAIGGLALAGSGLNTMSVIGIVILVGIAVNNAIIKIDLINQLRRAGTPRREAILHASSARLRAILMTSVTTVTGLLPMALGIGRGAELQAPMAIAIIGGITVATALTLIVIPVAYDLMESARANLSRPEPVRERRAAVVELNAAPGD